MLPILINLFGVIITLLLIIAFITFVLKPEVGFILICIGFILAVVYLYAIGQLNLVVKQLTTFLQSFKKVP